LLQLNLTFPAYVKPPKAVCRIARLPPLGAKSEERSDEAPASYMTL